MHWKKINNKDNINLYDKSISLIYSEFKKRGFEDISIVKNWNNIFLNSKIDSKKIKPYKIKNSILYLKTADLSFYSEFIFYKKEALELILKFNNKLNIADLKIKLID